MSIESKNILVRALDRALAPPAPPKPEDVAAATIKAVIGNQTVCSAEDKKRIQELDKQYGQVYQTVLDSDYAHAKIAFAEHQKAQVEMIAAGNFNDENFYTQAEYVSDFIERQASGKRSMRLISVAAQTISKSICERVAFILTEQADSNDREDREKYEHFSVPFTPSPLSVRLRQLAITVLARVSSGGSSRPAHYAGYLING